jgi:predicted MFS family arabinose efflux permease
LNEARLIWGVSVHQLVCWGTLYSSFPAFVAPMEAEFGWSRAEISGAFTAGLLVAGLTAIPVGRWVDRHGSRGVMVAGAAAGAVLLLGWAAVPSLVLFYLLWIAIGAVQALALSEPAYAALTANTRDPRRAVQYATFLTGLTTTIFLPLAAVMVERLGWRETLVVFAALQLVPAVLAAVTMRGARGSLAAGTSEPTGAALRRALRRRAFWALAVTFCCVAFVQTAISFHILPLLDERGLTLGAALLVVGAHGPCQLLARLVLFALGGKLADMRPVGLLAAALLPAAMVVLALGGSALPALLAYAVLFGAGSGLLTIVRAAGTAEILGQAGYAQISGALATAAVLPRTAAPLAVALVWEAAGGYGPVPWILVGVTAVGALAFAVAAADRAAG